VAAEDDVRGASPRAPGDRTEAGRRVTETKVKLGRAREDEAHTGALRREASYLVRAPSRSVMSRFVAVGDDVLDEYATDATVFFELRKLSTGD
jgi:hypothetical protein